MPEPTHLFPTASVYTVTCMFKAMRVYLFFTLSFLRVSAVGRILWRLGFWSFICSLFRFSWTSTLFLMMIWKRSLLMIGLELHCCCSSWIHSHLQSATFGNAWPLSWISIGWLILCHESRFTVRLFAFFSFSSSFHLSWASSISIASSSIFSASCYLVSA